MNTHLENITKAAQCAELLASDIRQAHSATCVEGALESLLGDALLPLIEQAVRIQQRLEAIQQLLK